MDSVTLKRKANYGYGKAARYLGIECEKYRPMFPTDPISELTYEGTLMVDFDPRPTLSARKVSGPRQPIWYAGCDATDILRGDFLIGEAGTFFVALLQNYLPPECIQCNVKLSIYRPTGDVPEDIRYYRAGNTLNSGRGAPLATNWPASMLEGTKGDRGVMGLPNDVKEPWFNVVMPELPGGLVPQTTDQFFDEFDRRYVISSPVRDEHGWRFTAGLAEV